MSISASLAASGPGNRVRHVTLRKTKRLQLAADCTGRPRARRGQHQSVAVDFHLKMRGVAERFDDPLGKSELVFGGDFCEHTLW